MTVALPHFEDDDARRANFEALLRRLIDTGGQSVGVRFGADTVTWPGGSQDSSATTVTHGLGKAPQSIQVTSGSVNSNPAYSNLTATTFDVTARTVDGTSPAAATARDFSWTVWG